MFDGLKKKLTGAVAGFTESMTQTGPPDLGAIPREAIGAGGLLGIPLPVIGGYLGTQVSRVEPMDVLGPEATGLIGRSVQQRLRQSQETGNPRPPGEFSAGQLDRAEAMMRASGAPEETIAAMRAEQSAGDAVRQGRAWTLTFSGGRRASVELVTCATDSGVFYTLQAHERNQRGMSATGQVSQDWSVGDVREVRGTDFETYHSADVLAARGRRFDALVKGALGAKERETMAALAAIALVSVEG
ncbi:MAG: hypothetical protein ABJD68_07765 [Nakamurella sp.]